MGGLAHSGFVSGGEFIEGLFRLQILALLRQAPQSPAARREALAADVGVNEPSRVTLTPRVKIAARTAGTVCVCSRSVVRSMCRSR